MIKEAFQKIFGRPPAVTAHAPGRVNLIGEHTDYNDGFVLPAAIDRAIEFAAQPRNDHVVHAYSIDFNDQVEFSLDAIEKDEEHPWSNYLRGVFKLMQEEGHRLAGADLAFGGNVPREAGLSSSAAVEVGAVALAMKMFEIKLGPLEVVRLARRAENEFVKVPCGIMDQFACAMGKRDHALFLDCRDLSYRYVPLSGRVKIVVCYSGVRRALAASEYEIRLKQCRQAVAQLGTTGLAVNSLREIDLTDLEVASQSLNEILLRRARHVVSENDRVLKAVKDLEKGDLESFGRLMIASHESLRDDYEVSCRELDLLVELALKQPGIIGSRMTGAGFGGCTVNLVRSDAAEAFAKAVKESYGQATGLNSEVYVCEASDGALASG
ncbi:MAG: galactokinase [Acidobacteria bacterium]|nr:MAG: galactokinase [Acidobacteriota bacterium]